MNTSCEIILDLIPLYLDDVCSEDSRRMVEKHISECENCRHEFSRMKHEIKTVSQFPSEEEIFKKASWTITKKQIITAAGILAIALYWVLFMWQRKMNLTNSVYYNYQLGRLLVFLFIPVVLGSLVWLIVTVGNAISTKTVAEKTPRIILLALLIIIQIFICTHLFIMRENIIWTEIVEVPSQNTIVIERYDGNTVVLETNHSVTALVRTDGTEYVVYYTSSINSPAHGELLWIIPAENAVTSDSG